MGLADVFLYTSEKVNFFCVLIGHFLLYSVTIKCLNLMIFYTSDEVGDDTHHKLVSSPTSSGVPKIVKMWEKFHTEGGPKEAQGKI